MSNVKISREGCNEKNPNESLFIFSAGDDSIGVSLFFSLL